MDYDSHYSIYLTEQNNDTFKESSLVLEITKNDELFRLLCQIGLAKETNGKRSFPIDNLKEAYSQLPQFRKFIHENAYKIVRTDRMIEVEESAIPSNIQPNTTYKYRHGNGKEYLYGIDTKKQLKQRFLLSDKLRKADDYYETFGISTIRGDWWDGFHLDMGNVPKEGGVEYVNGKKPIRLIKQLISFVSKDNDIILDSFAGSGTTAHAVLELNKEDGKKRKFILVQMTEATKKEPGKNVCKDKTQPRVINAINENRLEEGFIYQQLATAIDAEAMLTGTLPSYKEFAKYVYYLATGQSLANEAQISEESFYVGQHINSQVYLIYKQDLASLTKLALTLDIAERMKKLNQKSKKVVYAPACYLDEEYLTAYNIQFVSILYNLFDRVS